MMQAALNAAATTLNMTPDQLKQQLAQGKTLAQLAPAGMSEDTFKAQFTTNLKKELDPQVQAGKLTQTQEDKIVLKPGPGADKVRVCVACHSLDYIPMNSPFPNAALWDAEVGKMIKAFGAPISEADAKVIADYLKKNYGS